MKHKSIKLKCPDFLQSTRNSKLIFVDEDIIDTIKHLWKNKITTLGSCQGREELNEKPSVGISENYREKDIKKVLDLIKEVDNRKWNILQWKLSIVNNETNWKV